MGGKGSSTTTVQKSDPWAGQQPYLKQVFSDAQKLYDSGQMAPGYYAGQTVAAQSPWTQQSLQMQADRALNGSPYMDMAGEAVQGVMGGMEGNTGLDTLASMAQEDSPYADELYRRAQSQSQAALDSAFSRAGRYGSGAHEAASADAANELAVQMYSSLYDKRADAAAQSAQLYQSGLGQQLGAANMAYQLGNQAYADAAALSEAGGIMDDYAQQLINADIERWNYAQQAPIMALSNYNQLIQGNYGGTTTSTGQQGGGGVGNRVLSGAAAGAAIGNIVPGIGTALGAGIGGLLGLL